MTRSRLRMLCLSLWATGIALGGAQAWIARETVERDGSSYLDLSDAWMQGQWHAALNGLWSPMYPWLLVIGRVLLRPSWEHEFAVVHLVNFIIYVGALFSFHFFLMQWTRAQRTGAAAQNGLLPMPDWALITIGYSLFFWSSLRLIAVMRPSPDICTAACVYLIVGILIRIDSGRGTYRRFALLGLVLGLGYLTKAFLFPMAFVFLALALFSGRDRRAAASRTLLALLVFSLVAAPYVVALSRALGRWTFSEAGRLNYAWHVNGVLSAHWEGGPAGSGSPKHRAHRILGAIPVYAYDPSVWGTYPDWFDPTYWYEGVTLRFDPKQQIQALIAGSRLCAVLSVQNLMPLVAVLPVLILTGPRSGWRSRLAGQRLLLIPALLALFLYSLVHVEARYVAPFLVLFWLGIMGTIALPSSNESRRLLVGSAATILILMGVKVAGAVPQAISYRDDDLRQGWPQVASDLRKKGLRTGDRVAYLGHTVALWARRARVRIAADAFFEKDSDEARFWRLDDGARAALMGALAETGARAVVLQSYLSTIPPPGWRRIGATETTPSYFVCFLESGQSSAARPEELNP